VNRHQRRSKAPTFRLLGQVEISPSQYAALPTACAWGNCVAVACANGTALPRGWVYLHVFWQAHPTPVLDFGPGTQWYRDGLLCPEHVAALEQLLKPLPSPQLAEEPAGET
jgi:hypothetical protein